jgi:hypothetical protein
MATPVKIILVNFMKKYHNNFTDATRGAARNRLLKILQRDVGSATHQRPRPGNDDADGGDGRDGGRPWHCGSTHPLSAFVKDERPGASRPGGLLDNPGQPDAAIAVVY